MPNLRQKTWTTTTPANVGDAQYWEDHLISDADAAKAAGAVQSVNNTLPDENGNINIQPSQGGPTVIDSLNSTSATDALSANQGHVLKGLVDGKQDALTFDNAPTNGSDNPVKSNGIYDALTDVYGVMGENGAKNALPILLSRVKSLNTTGTWNNNVYTLNNIAYTFSTDSAGHIIEIDVDGTSSVFNGLSLEYWANNNLANDTDMIFSGCAANGSASSYRLALQFNTSASDTGAITYMDIGNGVSIPKESMEKPYYKLSLSITENTVMSHKKFYPMLRDARDTNPDFAPYAMTNAELTDSLADALMVTNDASQITGTGVTINDCVKAKAGNIRVYAIRFTPSGDVAAGTNIISGIDKPLLNAGGVINPIFADSSGTQYPMTSAYSGGNLLIKTINAIPSGTSVMGTVVYIAKDS